MKTWLEERIGNPDLFTGRKKELAFFMNWIDEIQQKISQSSAILSRRKTGKTALLQRLFNLTFHKNSRVIPFYFEIRESDQWLGDFAREFLLTFVWQYIAFKKRKSACFRYSKENYSRAMEIAQKEKLDYLCDFIEDAHIAEKHGNIDSLWNMARELPRMVAEHTNERIVQMIDEFQFVNRFIFRDKACTNRISNLAGSYLHTCEYKNAPLLVTGSWVGWLIDDLNRLLPGRFTKYPLESMPEDESAEMIYKFSLFRKIPVTEETVYLIARLAEGNPFYISALFGSRYPGKQLDTAEGVRKTLEFETLNLDANINATWMEYLDSAFSRINDIYAKDMVLYLSQNRHRYVSRRELKLKLKLDMSDRELEKKFRALFRADIIEESYGRYRGVQDNIFDKVFRRSYSDDIDSFVTKEAPGDYKALFEEIKEKYEKLKGDYSRYKGAFAEFMIMRHLISAYKNRALYRSAMENLPHDFEFTEYESVCSYHSPPLHDPEFQIDVFARAKEDEYCLIGEVKNRKAKFSLKEAKEFAVKAEELMRLEKIGKAVLFVFSVSGFYKNTLEYLENNSIAWTDDRQWLEKQ